MYQGKAIPRINMIIMVLMLLYAGQASASFKQCFVPCVIGCFLVPKDEFKCTFKCFAKCLTSPSSTSLDYCKLGCAADQCARFGRGKTYILILIKWMIVSISVRLENVASWGKPINLLQSQLPHHQLEFHQHLDS
ncbi:hypothetical protein Pfo_012059, partial [Paulownia fortunei]